MNSRNDIERKLSSMESHAQSLLQMSHEIRQLIQAGVSTPATDQPLTEQQLSEVIAKRRQRILKPRGK